MENKTGIELIAQERKEWLEKYGKELSAMVYIDKREMSIIAMHLISFQEIELEVLESKVSIVYLKTKWNELWLLEQFKKSYAERLSISGNLIAAELDRLNHIKY